MTDKYYVYRPMLNLIGISEGTLEHRGYNETLGYGAFTGGDVVLVDMTLAEIDKLQTKMLRHPKNTFNSSALGMYQIVQKTRRWIQKTLRLDKTALFDADMQDRMACFLLGYRGVDKWMSRRMSMNTLMTGLAQEWASLPTLSGESYYGGKARVTVEQVKAALGECLLRHNEGQPKQEVPVVTEKVEKEVRQKTNWLTSIFGAGGVLSALFTWMSGADNEKIIIVFGAGVVVCVAVLIGGEWIVHRVKAIRKELRE